MRRRLEEQGLPDIKPNIMVVTRLLPQVRCQPNQLVYPLGLGLVPYVCVVRTCGWGGLHVERVLYSVDRPSTQAGFPTPETSPKILLVVVGGEILFNVCVLSCAGHRHHLQ